MPEYQDLRYHMTDEIPNIQINQFLIKETPFFMPELEFCRDAPRRVSTKKNDYENMFFLGMVAMKSFR
jgi:hypothetical protein